MSRSEPPELAMCDEHGLVLLEDDTPHHTFCIACETGLPFEPDKDPVPNQRLGHDEFANRLEADAVRELVPLMEEYLDDRDQGPAWVTHTAYPGQLPAGYTEQERFVPAIGYAFGSMEKHIITNPAAVATVGSLREEGYGA